MGRSVCLAGVALAIWGLCNVGYSLTSSAQTSNTASSIAKFADVAGKWTGHANNHNVTLEIDATGKFRAKSALGGESGEARLEDGTLVIPLVEHDGTLQLVLVGDTLSGPGLLDGKTWMVSLTRNGPAVKAD
jgi:hypothetical protein